MKTHLVLLLPTAFAAAAIADHWIVYDDATTERLVAADDVGAGDVQEKDYAVGDLDGDGDDDIVVMRKQPFTSTGRYRNVLLMNEGVVEGHAVNGVLVDRTLEYATASDVVDDEGFLTPTNDRDVAIVDVDNDGWLDVVTATALTDNMAKHISHPRVYMNLGEQDGDWLGLRYEDARIPEMHPAAGPRFGAVAAGDVTGDGFADLYFADYDSGGNQIHDYNNKLLINDGTGHFADETDFTTFGRLTEEMSNSAFGAAAVIADMNNDGVADIVKLTALNVPTHIAITYNNTENEGFFAAYDPIYQQAGYWVNAGDLNGDGQLDLVVSDNGLDRVLLHDGLDPLGRAQFTQHALPDTGGFTTNSRIADFNNDGLVDFVITDIDDDIPGCSRTTKFHRNVGGDPVVFEQQGFPLGETNSSGIHDMAVLDLNQDGWLDLLVGRCTGTVVYLNVAPAGLLFSYVDGLAAVLAPDEATTISVAVLTTAGQLPDLTGGRLFYAVDGGPMTTLAMSVEDNVLTATIPPQACLTGVDYHVQAFLADGGSFSDPPDAPADQYHAFAATGTELTLRDELEDDTSAWQVVNETGLAAGGWEAAVPIGTVTISGGIGAPDQDATGGDGVRCFVTLNGEPAGAAADSDVDGGPTHLVSPAIDLDGADAVLSWSQWFTNEFGTADTLTVALSNDDGQNWVTIPELTTGGTDEAWETASVRVGEHITPTTQVRVRFTTDDTPNDSVTEAGIDDFQVETILCAEACPADTTGDGVVSVDDLVAVISNWGPCPGCDADIDGSGVVDVNDLVAVISAWGGC